MTKEELIKRYGTWAAVIAAVATPILKLLLKVDISSETLTMIIVAALGLVAIVKRWAKADKSFLEMRSNWVAGLGTVVTCILVAIRRDIPPSFREFYNAMLPAVAGLLMMLWVSFAVRHTRPPSNA